MAKNEVQIKVATDVELAKVQALEDRIRELNRQKIQMDIETNTSRLEEVNSRIETVKSELKQMQGDVDVDDADLKKVETELEQLESEKINLEIAIEEGKLDAVKSEIDSLDDEPIRPQIDNISAMEGIEQISQGFDRLKQGAGEIGDKLEVALQSAGKQETNKTFLEMAVGADEASSAMEKINKIVQNLPGDDTAVQGLLSQSIAKDASLTEDTLSSIGTAYADYASAMSFYGKSSIEAQQDMTNYILAGNTAELERSPILASHIDDLKEANTIQERAQVLQEALNEEHWGGMSQQDTYNNKLETFNGMLERGQYNLGGMFQEGAKSAMDFALKLDDASGGLVGIGLAAIGFAGPVADSVMGLGQMATGIKAIKDLGMVQYLRDLELGTKLSAAADWLLSGAQAVLNAVMSLNPIVLVVLALVALAAALIWAYYNVDWFREMVDNAWASIQQFANEIWNTISPAIQWLGDLFNQFTSQLGLNTDDWLQAILGFILFIPQLPAQLAIALFDAIAQALGFGTNFHQTMTTSAFNAVNGFITYIATLPGRAYTYLANLLSRVVSWGGSVASNFLSAASRSVSNFMSYISTLPGKLAAELQNMLSTVSQWAATLPQKFWDAGVNAVKNFLDALGIHSPGTMQTMMLWEVSEMARRVPLEGRELVSNVENLGSDIVDGFNPELEMSYGTNGDLTGGSGNITINMEIGSVDNEDRVNEIVDAVRRALVWNNETAGRTV